MKKVYGLLLLAVFLFAAGCKLDPPVVPAYLQDAKLLGKWYLIDMEITNDDGSPGGSITDFTDKDFFDFKTGNAATYSSTIYGKTYEGYFSANSLNNPNTLSFKSGDLLLKYDSYSIDQFGNLIMDQIVIDTSSGIPTTTTYSYTYTKTL
jgi:hypothetical protein